MEIRKEKGVLKFIKTTGDIATVSMIDGTMREFKSDKGKWIDRKSLTRFFSGNRVGEMEHWKSEDKYLPKLIKHILYQHDKAHNIGTFLKEITQYNEVEKLMRMGFNIPINCRIHEKLKCPKDILNIVRGIFIDCDSQIVAINDIKNHKYFRLAPKDSRFIELLTNQLGGGYYWEKPLKKLLDFMSQRKLNLQKSIEYIHYLYTYEGLSPSNINNFYQDYVDMQEKMGKTPEKYPKFLNSKHDIVNKQYELYKKTFNEEMFISRYKTDLEYVDSEFMILQPKSTMDLKEEGIALHHCVESYIDRVIDGDCLIYFMRKKAEESYLTIEIQDNAIAQVRGMYNRLPNDIEKKKLLKWAKAKNIKGGIICLD